jgi:NAD(P)-dependent dehydrogenase (short-subunit alcohol dehydrogenase family)
MGGVLEGRRMVVTGAARGIGRAVAAQAAAAGARVGLIDIDADELAAAAAAIGPAAIALPCDVSDEAAVAAACDTAASAFGGIDAAALVAGIEFFRAGDDRVDRLPLDLWRQIIDVNLTGMFLSAKHAARTILATGGGGSITLTGSPCAITGKCGGETAYSASKAGVHGLVRVMATDLAPEKVRVNGVIPGFVATRLNAPVLADAGMLAGALSAIPLGRVAQPEEIAPLFVWLASEAAAYVTGAFITADGGMTAA